jgi:hypothetical protein
MEKLPDNTPNSDVYEEEQHLATRSKIETELAKQYQVDFPDYFFKTPTKSMDQHIIEWMEKHKHKVQIIIHRNIEERGPNNYIARYERATTDQERQAVIEEIKNELYGYTDTDSYYV